MFFLRKSFVWLMTAWVACGPAALFLHHALAHSGGTSSQAGLAQVSGEDGSNDKNSRAILLANHRCHSSCHAGFGSSGSGDGAGNHEGSDPSSCQVCDFLLHSHAAADWDPLVVAVDAGVVAEFGCEARIAYQQPHGAWGLRGPPSC